MTLPVFYDPAADPQAAELVLGGTEGRHAVNVRRIGPGEFIDVVNGRGLRLRVQVTAVEPGQARGVVVERTQELPSRPHLTLVQALAKGGRDEQAIETCTEFGIDAVVPWQAERSIVRWDAKKAAKGQARFEQTALAAAKQSRRACVPVVHELQTSAQLTKWIAGQPRVFVLHEEATRPLTDYLGEGFEAAALVVGPEGGISEQELAAFVRAGAIPVLLGRHVLRSATAGAWATAVIRAQLG